MDRLLKAARASGSLNLSNRSLTEIPDEVYRNLEGLGGGDDKWWEAVELQKLILAHNSIASLKEDLRNLPFLAVLNLSHNSLSQLPAAIGELPQLKMLDVSFNSIVNIPEEIGSAMSLVKLDCSNNQLTELPSSLGRCLELSDLKGNKLTVISENLISSWTMLTEFNASKNLLNGIPTSIGGLSRLIRVYVHQNSEFYKQGNNNISTLPVEIGALSRLGTLDLHSNQLKDYPVEACKLSLLVLDLSNNSLSGLPPEMGKTILFTDIESLPFVSCLGKMTTLRKLLLSGNPMRTLRSSLVSGPTPALLKFLRSRLSEDEDSEAVTTTKEVIAMATRLSITSKELSMEGLGLSAVPSEVWESGEVIKLNLSRNSIQELPVELSSCVSLQIPLDGFEVVPKLQILDLSGNAASLLDVPAFSSLPYLQELYLRLGLKDLTSLKELDLSNNNISVLLPELGLLEPSLQALRLDGNPLRRITTSSIAPRSLSCHVQHTHIVGPKSVFDLAHEPFRIEEGELLVAVTVNLSAGSLSHT
ncbi:hypothetical protein JHK84_035008 [Glycine max]|nr:hypothetical protein JHK84_035008 [Glycine max]